MNDKPKLHIVKDEDSTETTEDTSEEKKVLSRANELLEEVSSSYALDSVMVMGISDNGFPVLAASDIDVGTGLLLMELQKKRMTHSMEQLLEEPEGPLN